jgi:hypothetical protein
MGFPWLTGCPTQPRYEGLVRKYRFLLIRKDAVTFKSHIPLRYGKILPIMEGV